MSYTSQTIGVPDPTQPDFDVDLDGDGVLDARARLDYSRVQLFTLDESQLVDSYGVQGGTTDLLVWSIDAGETLQIASGAAEIDWNVNGVIDTPDAPSALDINNLGDFDCGLDVDDGTPTPSPGELLFGHNDWPNLKFRAVLSVNAGDSPPPVEHELDFQTSQRIKARMAAALKADPAVSIVASPATVVTGATVTLTITVSNSRPVQADNVVLTDTLPAGLTFVSCAASGGGVCGGSGNNRTVTFPVLAGQSSETVTLVAAVDCAIPDGTSVGNSVSLTSATPDFDPGNNAASASVTASNPPPVISSPSISASVLWPPSHAMRDISVEYSVTDNCGTPTLSVSVASSEPVDAAGDGATVPDWEVLDAHHVRLRAERAGSGSGRVYTITITATDSGGGSSSKQVQVLVPKSRN
jgi:uncharacterized repeat protein (TIGR01451 family)